MNTVTALHVKVCFYRISCKKFEATGSYRIRRVLLLSTSTVPYSFTNLRRDISSQNFDSCIVTACVSSQMWTLSCERSHWSTESRWCCSELPSSRVLLQRARLSRISRTRRRCRQLLQSCNPSACVVNLLTLKYFIVYRAFLVGSCWAKPDIPSCWFVHWTGKCTEGTVGCFC